MIDTVRLQLDLLFNRVVTIQREQADSIDLSLLNIFMDFEDDGEVSSYEVNQDIITRDDGKTVCRFYLNWWRAGKEDELIRDLIIIDDEVKTETKGILF